MAVKLRRVDTYRPEAGREGQAPVFTSVPTPFHQAYGTLRFGYTVLPIVAGLDKFFYVLVSWDQYVAPFIPNVLGINPRSFMVIVGVIEIIAGIGVALKPRIFGYVVGLWLLGIVVNLLMTGEYFDIALRDFGLALGAFSLARLSQWFDSRRATSRKGAA